MLCASAEDADAYAIWLSKESKQTYRLPSEAEWEYAARAGTTTARFWGNGRDDACLYANVADQSLAATIDRAANPSWEFFSCPDTFVHTAPVGSFRANPWDLYDMLGNVWQWTADVQHNNYTGAPTDGSVWAMGGDNGRRVLRGGSWSGLPGFVRAGVRNNKDRGNRNSNTGFRLSRTLSSP